MSPNCMIITPKTLCSQVFYDEHNPISIVKVQMIRQRITACYPTAPTQHLHGHNRLTALIAFCKNSDPKYLARTALSKSLLLILIVPMSLKLVVKSIRSNHRPCCIRLSYFANKNDKEFWYTCLTSNFTGSICCRAKYTTWILVIHGQTPSLDPKKAI